MKLLVVLCLVAMVAGQENQCGPLQKLKVKEQWNLAFGTAHARVDFGTAMWRGFFRQAPQSIDELFTRVDGNNLYSGAFQAHSLRVLGGLNMVISIMDDTTLLATCLEHLRNQHRERGIPQNYFQLFKNSLMKVVPAAIGRCFDPVAWSACYDVIANAITDY